MNKHRPSYYRANDYSHEARREYENEAFVEVEPVESVFCKTNSSQDSYFFGLFNDVCRHGSREGKKAQTHCENNDKIENHI